MRYQPGSDGGGLNQVPERYRFGCCSLDVARRELRVGGEITALQPRLFDLLLALIQRPGRVLSKQELVELVWPTTHVTDAVVTTAIARIRRAILDLDPLQPILHTVHGVGYRLDAEVTTEDPAHLLSEIEAVEPLSGQVPAPRDDTRVPPPDPEETHQFWTSQWLQVEHLHRQAASASALAVAQVVRAQLGPDPRRDVLLVTLLRERLRVDEAAALLAELGQRQTLPTPVKMAAWLERAHLAILNDDHLGAIEDCDAVLEQDEPSPEVVPIRLAAQLLKGRSLYLRDEHIRVLELLDVLEQQLQLPRDLRAAVAAKTLRARTSYSMGRVSQAFAEVREGLALGRGCGDALRELSDACAAQGYMFSNCWRFDDEVDMARRALSFTGDESDLPRRDRARMREVNGLIGAGRLDEAETQLAGWQAATCVSASVPARFNLQMMSSELAWRRGHAADALGRWRALVQETQNAATASARTLLKAEVAMKSLAIGDLGPASALLAGPSRRLSTVTDAMLGAGLALVAGDRARAMATLRRAWLSSRPHNLHANEMLVSLAFLCIEDRRTAWLQELMPSLAQLPASHSAVAFLREARSLHESGGATGAAGFETQARRNCGLVNRHAWLLDDAGRQAWLSGERQLGELLGTAWY